jgi:ribosomal protein L18E
MQGVNIMAKTLGMRQAASILDVSVQAAMSFMKDKKFNVIRKDGNSINSAYLVDAGSFTKFVKDRINKYEGKVKHMEDAMKDLDKNA